MLDGRAVAVAEGMRSVVPVGLLVLLTSTNALAQDERSLTLSEVVTTARARSADVRAARANAEGAEAAADAAYAGYLPSASGQASALRSWSHSYQPDANGIMISTPQAAIGANVAGTLKWTAWDFGRTSSAVAGAKAEARAAAANAEVAANDAVRTAASLFLRAVFDEELVQVAQATVKLREKHANMSRAMVMAGTRPPVEEARARVELSLARLELTSAEQRLAQDRVRLTTALMMDPNAKPKLIRPAVLPTVRMDGPSAADRAVAHRPDVRAAEETVTAREEGVDAAKAQRYPTIGVSLEGLYRANRPDDDNRFFPNSSITALATLTIPIFDWGLWGAIPVARGELASAEAKRDGTRLRVQGEAAEAVVAVSAAATLAEQARSARELSAATLAVIEARYQAGIAGPLELFDAGKNDADARTAAIRAEQALATATVEALAATGRLSELVR